MNVFKRNKPILYVGIVTAIIFSVIIVIGQLTKSGPNLKDSPQTFEVEERETTSESTSSEYDSDEITITPPEVETPTGISNLPVLQMDFTEFGFSPVTHVGQVGQILKWTNQTDQTIVISELIKKNSHFRQGDIAIEPFATYELQLEGKGIWTFEEKNSEKTGRMIITE